MKIRLLFLVFFLALIPQVLGDQVLVEKEGTLELIYTGETSHIERFTLDSLEGVEEVEVSLEARVTPSGYNDLADGTSALLVQLNSELPKEGDFGLPDPLAERIEEEFPAFKQIAEHSIWFIPRYFEGSLGTKGRRVVVFDRSSLVKGRNVLLLQVLEGGEKEGEGDGIFISLIEIKAVGDIKVAPVLIEATLSPAPTQETAIEPTRPPVTERLPERPRPVGEARPPPESSETNWEAIGVILLVVGGATGWIFSRRKRGRVKKLIDETDRIYSSFKMKSRRCEAELYRLKDMVLDEFKNGKIDEHSYAIIDKRIEDYLKEVREQIVNERFGGMPTAIRQNLKAMMEDGEISEADFKNLQRILREASDVGEKDKEELSELFEKWKKEDQK